MRKPMTTKQAYAAYLCSQCKAGDDCGYECVEGSTNSFTCGNPLCKERIWFQGNIQDAPIECKCPYCGEKQYPYKGFRRSYLEVGEMSLYWRYDGQPGRGKRHPVLCRIVDTKAKSKTRQVKIDVDGKKMWVAARNLSRR